MWDHKCGASGLGGVRSSACRWLDVALPLGWRADPEVSEGEESHKLIVRDREALSRIYQRLKYERGW